MQRNAWLLAIVVAFAVATNQARAQGAGDYPTRGITLVMPLAAGSAGDVLGRLVATKMAADLGRSIVVENVTGASGQIGIDRVNRADPDGYTVMGTGDNQLIYTPLFNKRSSFDPLNDFAPITQLAMIEWALVAHPAFPAKTVQELVALAKSKPGEINFSSGGLGSAQQIAMELFMAKTGIKLTHVPYRGATPALNDVVSGVIPLMFTATSVGKAFVDGGTLRVIATTGAKRSALLPEVPTVAEAGVPDFEFATWMGFLAPGKTPPAIVARLNAAAAAAVKDPQLQPQMRAGGFAPVGSSPDEFRRTIARDHARIKEIMQTAGIGAK